MKTACRPGRYVTGSWSSVWWCRAATWYPEGESECGIGVASLALEGQAPQIPGPLIRVGIGTRLRVTVRNEYRIPLSLRGFVTT